MSDNNTELTTTLIPKSRRSLKRLENLTGLSEADIVNRALQLYERLEIDKSRGASVWVAVDSMTMEELIWE